MSESDEPFKLQSAKEKYNHLGGKRVMRDLSTNTQPQKAARQLSR